MAEKLGIMSDPSACNAQAGRSIGVLAGDTGIGEINEDVFDGAAFSVTGIIIGEPFFTLCQTT